MKHLRTFARWYWRALKRFAVHAALFGAGSFYGSLLAQGVKVAAI